MTESTFESLPQAYLDQIRQLLEQVEGRPIRAYKASSLTRRIRRRQQLSGQDDLEGYLALLRQSPEEAHSLAAELLIGVTAFFRDHEAFELLRTQVLPELMAERSEGLRIWVPACASGEEVYSLAMLVDRQARASGVSNWQIFATDLDREAIAKASLGRYPFETPLSEDLRREYFLPIDHAIQVKPSLREHIVFAVHDLLIDPPFGQMDLVSCRNLLIYLRPEYQQRLFQMFGYAVRPGGWLMLGPSETLPENYGFEEYSHNWKLYRRQSGVLLRQPGAESLRGRMIEAPFEARPLSEQVQQQLIAAYVPRGMVFRENFELLHISGMEQYLRLPAGAATLNVLELLPPAWAVPLSLGVSNLLQDHHPVSLQLPEHDQALELVLELLPPLAGSREHLIHARLGGSVARLAHPLTLNLAEEGQARLLQLERELRRNQERLQSTVNELAGSNEELQATNEELKSTNEALENINNDYHQKVDELSAANDDLHNLLQSTEIATLFLDEELRIRRFTETLHRILPLLPQDIGRPLAHFHNQLISEDLLSEIAEVGRSFRPRERQLHTGERSYILRMHPFRSRQALYKGVVLTFVDVTQLMQTRRELESYQEERDRSVALYHLIADNIHDVIVVLDAAGRIDYLSPSAAELTGRGSEELLASHFAELATPAEQPALAQALAELDADGGSRLIEFRLVHRESAPAWVEADLRGIGGEDRPRQILGTLRAIDERKRAELELRQSETQLRAIFQNVQGTLVLIDDQHRIVAFNDKAQAWAIRYGRPEMVIGGSLSQMPSPEYHDDFAAQIQPVLETGSMQAYERAYTTAEGRVDWYLITISPVREADGRISGACVSSLDITARKQAELATEESRARLEAVFVSSQESLMLLDCDLKVLAYNPGIETWIRQAELRPISLGISILDILPDGVRESFAQDMLSVFRDGRAVEVERKFSNSHGESAWYVVTRSPVFDREGGIIGICVSARDITRRKLAEMAIQESEAQLQAIFHSIDDSLLLLDAQLTLLAFNDKAQAWSRRQGQPQLQVGQSMLAAAPPERRAAFENQLRRVLAGETIEYETYYPDPPGQEGWYLVTLSPVREAGGISGLCISGRDITARKQAEIELHQSEARMRAIFENVRDILILLDREQKVVAFNAKAAEWTYRLGRPAIAVGAYLPEIIATEHSEAYLAQMRTVLDEGKLLEYERLHTSPNGEIVWYLVSLLPVREADGSISGVSISGRDITERKRSELLLSQLNARLQKAQQVADLGYWDYEPAFDRLSCSPKSCSIFGVDGERESHGFADLLARVHPDDRERVQQAWQAMLAGEPLNLVHRLMLPAADATASQHEIRHVRQLAQPRAQAQQGPSGPIEGSVQDITEWYQAEQELTQLFEQSSDLIAICDLQGGLRKLNPAFGAILGYQPELGATLPELIHPHEAPAMRREFDKLGRGQGSLNVENRVRCADESWRWITWKATAMEDTGLVYVTGHDVTERKAAEAQLAEYADRLTLILESITDAFVTLDAEGRFTYANQAAVRLLQLDEEKLVGNSLWALFPVSEGPLFADRYRWALIYQEPVHFEVHNRRLGAWLEVSVYPSEENFSVFFRDITEIKLSRSATELERELTTRYTSGRESLSELLDAALKQAEQLLPGATCLIQVPREDRLVTLSAPSLPPEWLSILSGQPLAPGYGTAVTAAQLHKPALSPEMESDPAWSALRTQLSACELEAAWSYPVLSPEHELLAVFSCFFTRPCRPRLPESQLADRIAKLLAELLENQPGATQHESQQRWELLNRATLDAIWDWHPQTDELIWNHQISGLFGYAASEIDSSIAWRNERMHPADREAVLQSLQTHLAQHAPHWRAEYRFRCADGSWKHVLDRACLLYDDTGAPIRLLGAMEDISERKIRELRLQKIAQRYEAAARAVDGIVWDWDLETDLIEWHPALVPFSGYAESEIGDSLDWFLETIHPDDRFRIRTSLQNVITLGRRHWQEGYAFRCADGSYKSVFNQAHVMADEDGKAFRMVGVMRESTH